MKGLAWLVGLAAAGMSLALSALEIEGQWREGHLLTGRVEAGSSVSFRGRSLRVSDDGLFVIGLDRDTPEQVTMTVTSPDGETSEHQFEVAQRAYNIQRIEGVPPETVNPPPDVLPRIRRESELTREARQQDLPRRNFLEDFRWPLRGTITGVYGSQRFYNGEPRRPHYGIDIAQPSGTPVVAPAGGVVTLAYDDMFFSGGTLIIDHGHGVSSTFIHLSEILVTEGQEVAQGETVAEVGATGRSTGPHLDWRINWFNYRLDPQSLVPPMPE